MAVQVPANVSASSSDVQVGEKEFVMRPEIDLPEISIESALEEERELAEYMTKLRLEKQAAAAGDGMGWEAEGI